MLWPWCTQQLRAQAVDGAVFSSTLAFPLALSLFVPSIPVRCELPSAVAAVVVTAAAAAAVAGRQEITLNTLALVTQDIWTN